MVDNRLASFYLTNQKTCLNSLDTHTKKRSHEVQYQTETKYKHTYSQPEFIVIHIKPSSFYCVGMNPNLGGGGCIGGPPIIGGGGIPGWII